MTDSTRLLSSIKKMQRPAAPQHGLHTTDVRNTLLHSGLIPVYNYRTIALLMHDEWVLYAQRVVQGDYPSPEKPRFNSDPIATHGGVLLGNRLSSRIN